VRRGTMLADWFAGEAERVYAMLAEAPEDRPHRRLVEWIRGRGGRVSVRDVQREGPRPWREKAQTALADLVADGLGEWRYETAPDTGRQSRVFVLHGDTGDGDTSRVPDSATGGNVASRHVASADDDAADYDLAGLPVPEGGES
jgi:hypothetical protein